MYTQNSQGISRPFLLDSTLLLLHLIWDKFTKDGKIKKEKKKKREIVFVRTKFNIITVLFKHQRFLL